MTKKHRYALLEVYGKTTLIIKVSKNKDKLERKKHKLYAKKLEQRLFGLEYRVVPFMCCK